MLQDMICHSSLFIYFYDLELQIQHGFSLLNATKKQTIYNLDDIFRKRLVKLDENNGNEIIIYLLCSFFSKGCNKDALLYFHFSQKSLKTKLNLKNILQSVLSMFH